MLPVKPDNILPLWCAVAFPGWCGHTILQAIQSNQQHLVFQILVAEIEQVILSLYLSISLSLPI